MENVTREGSGTLLNCIILSLALLWTTESSHPSAYGQVKRGRLDIFCPAPFVARGDRTEQEVTEAIQAKLIYFAKCYKVHFSAGGAETFKVRFRFTIHPSGAIGTILVVHPGTTNKVFLDCLTGVIGRIQFQHSESHAESVVEQSVIFKII